MYSYEHTHALIVNDTFTMSVHTDGATYLFYHICREVSNRKHWHRQMVYGRRPTHCCSSVQVLALVHTATDKISIIYHQHLYAATRWVDCSLLLLCRSPCAYSVFGFHISMAREYVVREYVIEWDTNGTISLSKWDLNLHVHIALISTISLSPSSSCSIPKHYSTLCVMLELPLLSGTLLSAANNLIFVLTFVSHRHHHHLWRMVYWCVVCKNVKVESNFIITVFCQPDIPAGFGRSVRRLIHS